MYATDRQTSDRLQTKASLNASALWGQRHNNSGKYAEIDYSGPRLYDFYFDHVPTEPLVAGQRHITKCIIIIITIIIRWHCVPSQTPVLSSAKYGSTFSVGRYHGMYHGITAHRCIILDDISTMEFTDFLCITVPQIPRFYRTVLANHKQRSNALSERLHLKLSASTQLNSKLESTPHGHESERIHGHFYTHRHTEI